MKKIIAFFLLIVMTLSLTACNPSSGTKPAESSRNEKAPVRIGFEAVFGGTWAYVGESSWLCLQDEVAKINANGGILGGRPIELYGYDISKDFAEGISVTNKLIEQDKVSAIIGPDGTDYAVVVDEIAANAKVPMICTGASGTAATVDPDTNLAKPYMFRTCITAPYSGKVMASYAYNTLGLRKMYTMTCITAANSVEAAKVFKTEFEALGGTILGDEGWNIDDVEFRSQLTKIQASEAEGIFCPSGEYTQFAMCAMQAKDLGMNTYFLGGEGCYAPELLEMVKGACDGNTFFSVGGVTFDPKYDEFNSTYTKNHPGASEVNQYAYYTLDALYTLIQAMENAGTDKGEAVRDALEGITCNAFTGEIKIDPATHNPIRGAYVLGIDNSEFFIKEFWEAK